MEHIYIMSCQRNQGGPEIHSLWTTYESAIMNYYQYLIDKKYTSDGSLNFMYLYKLPLNEDFKENGNSWSDIKLQKTCKHRVKFKTFKDLENEYTYVLRGKKLERIVDESE